VPREHSREAAEEYSARRKPWVPDGTQPSPEGAKETLRHRFLAVNADALPLSRTATEKLWTDHEPL